MVVTGLHLAELWANREFEAVKLGLSSEPVACAVVEDQYRDFEPRLGGEARCEPHPCFLCSGTFKEIERWLRVQRIAAGLAGFNRLTVQRFKRCNSFRDQHIENETVDGRSPDDLSRRHGFRQVRVAVCPSCGAQVDFENRHTRRAARRIGRLDVTEARAGHPITPLYQDARPLPRRIRTPLRKILIGFELIGSSRHRIRVRAIGFRGRSARGEKHGREEQSRNWKSFHLHDCRTTLISCRFRRRTCADPGSRRRPYSRRLDDDETARNGTSSALPPDP